MACGDRAGAALARRVLLSARAARWTLPVEPCRAVGVGGSLRGVSEDGGAMACWGAFGALVPDATFPGRG